MNAPVVKQRKRAGSCDAWDRRYSPIPCDDGSLIRDWRDAEIQSADVSRVWSVIEENGVLYVVPGLATVNYVGRVLCAVPWGPSEENNTGYRY